jgi:hypothetical protein
MDEMRINPVAYATARGARPLLLAAKANTPPEKKTSKGRKL